MDNIISLLTAFGLGSIVTTGFQAWLAQKSSREDRRFCEKKEAYLGLLDALRRAAHEKQDEAYNFAFWKMRSDIVSSNAVRNAVESVVNTRDDHSSNRLAQKSLLEAIRADLGVAK